MGQLIPLFWTYADISPAFQRKGGSLACFLTCVILRFTSGVTPADSREVIMTVEPFLSTYSQTCLQALVEFWPRFDTGSTLVNVPGTSFQGSKPSPSVPTGGQELA